MNNINQQDSVGEFFYKELTQRCKSRIKEYEKKKKGTTYIPEEHQKISWFVASIETIQGNLLQEAISLYAKECEDCGKMIPGVDLIKTEKNVKYVCELKMKKASTNSTSQPAHLKKLENYCAQQNKKEPQFNWTPCLLGFKQEASAKNADGNKVLNNSLVRSVWGKEVGTLLGFDWNVIDNGLRDASHKVFEDFKPWLLT